MYLNAQSIKKLDAALKVINQRIARAGQTFGRDSNVYKNMISPFETSDLKQFIGTSKSGDFKFKRAAIEKALADGRNYQELERVLNAAGYKVGKPGFLRQTKKGKTIETVRDIKKKWRSYLDPENNKTEEELIDDINLAEGRQDSFRDLVYEAFSTFGRSEVEADYPDLFTGKGGRKRKLTEAEFEMYRKEMISRLIFEEKQESHEVKNRILSYKSKRKM